MEKIANKYNIIKELGVGGTGNVYLVEHEDLKIQYALKLLSEEISNNPVFVDQFIREARILEKFSHKNIAQLRDFGKNSDGRYYMTTDFCEGITLSHYIENHKITTYKTAIKIIIDILNVLKDAHDMGIIHRDIKPDNIMINFEKDSENYTDLKILDFGIAKMKHDTLSKNSGDMKGVTFGTPQYMSPEQTTGNDNIDNRSDLYSTGIILYELLCGHVPFCGETVMKTLLMHLTQPVPNFDESLNIPSNVTAIINKALQKIPDNRYQNANDFIKDCKSVLCDETTIENSTNANDIYVISHPPKEKTNIVCIDDNEMILNIMEHILRKEGYDATTTSDPEMLYNYLFQKQPDLLISDINMPAINGNEICKMLKQTMPTLKIALFSNVPEQELESLAKEANADAWISKNEKPDTWVKQISEILKTN